MTQPLLFPDQTDPDATVPDVRAASIPLVDRSLQRARDEWMNLLADGDAPSWQPDEGPPPIRKPPRWGVAVRFALAAAVLGSTTAYATARLLLRPPSAEPEPEISVTWLPMPKPEVKRVHHGARKSRTRTIQRSRAALQLHLARRAVEQRRWRTALRRSKAVLQKAPRNRRARRIAKLARQSIDRSTKRVRRAERALKRRRWRRARDWAAAALRIDPRDRRARRIKRVAQIRLRRRG